MADGDDEPGVAAREDLGLQAGELGLGKLDQVLVAAVDLDAYAGRGEILDEPVEQRTVALLGGPDLAVVEQQQPRARERRGARGGERGRSRERPGGCGQGDGAGLGHGYLLGAGGYYPDARRCTAAFPLLRAPKM